jgi:hypothetical protein
MQPPLASSLIPMALPIFLTPCSFDSIFLPALPSNQHTAVPLFSNGRGERLFCGHVRAAASLALPGVYAFLVQQALWSVSAGIILWKSTRVRIQNK